MKEGLPTNFLRMTFNIFAPDFQINDIKKTIFERTLDPLPKGNVYCNEINKITVKLYHKQSEERRYLL